MAKSSIDSVSSESTVYRVPSEDGEKLKLALRLRLGLLSKGLSTADGELPYNSFFCTSATFSQSSTARSAFSCAVSANLFWTCQRWTHTLRRCISRVPSAFGELNSSRPSLGLAPSESWPKTIVVVTAALRMRRCVPSARRTKRAFFGDSLVTLSLMLPTPRSFHPRSLPSPSIVYSFARPTHAESSCSSPVSLAGGVSVGAVVVVYCDLRAALDDV